MFNRIQRFWSLAVPVFNRTCALWTHKGKYSFLLVKSGIEWTLFLCEAWNEKRLTWGKGGGALTTTIARIRLGSVSFLQISGERKTSTVQQSLLLAAWETFQISLYAFCEAPWQNSLQLSTAGKWLQYNCGQCPEDSSGPCKPQSSAVCITCFIAVLPIRAVYTLKAACGFSLNNALPGAWQAVHAAVREGHLQEKNPKRVNSKVLQEQSSYSRPWAYPKGVTACLTCKVESLRHSPLLSTEDLAQQTSLNPLQ